MALLATVNTFRLFRVPVRLVILTPSVGVCENFLVTAGMAQNPMPPMLQKESLPSLVIGKNTASLLLLLDLCGTNKVLQNLDKIASSPLGVADQIGYVDHGQIRK